MGGPRRPRPKNLRVCRFASSARRASSGSTSAPFWKMTGLLKPQGGYSTDDVWKDMRSIVSFVLGALLTSCVGGDFSQAGDDLEEPEVGRSEATAGVTSHLRAIHSPPGLRRRLAQPAWCALSAPGAAVEDHGEAHLLHDLHVSRATRTGPPAFWTPPGGLGG
ncbi:unnamed protein product [Prorocentrum cordatum]|uniref:H(+)-exporting diphosphatase n=1 Tax=Prorocentrum cordatum TaxID=2364126 RepID=A0ABN9PPW3_9DINO|nr:unnamed protein product [Polarella glacialis]